MNKDFLQFPCNLERDGLVHREITDYSPVESYYDNLRWKDFELPNHQ